jgi:hypothetical protein
MFFYLRISSYSPCGKKYGNGTNFFSKKERKTAKEAMAT